MTIETLELSKRLEQLAEYLEDAAVCFSDSDDEEIRSQIGVVSQWAADVRRLIIPEPKQ